MTKLDRSDIALALIAIACGGCALLAASGMLPMQSANDTPMWIIGLAGVMFGLGTIFYFSGFLYALKRHFGSRE